MTDGLSTSIFRPALGDAPDITAVIYVGPAMSADTPTLDALQDLPEFAQAFRLDHALGVRSVEDHSPFLEILIEPERLPVVQNRLREDLPTHGRCLLFLPSLNSSAAAAQDLAPLTQALLDTGFKAIEMIIAASDPEAPQPLKTHATAIGWPHPISIRAFGERPVVHRGILGAEAVTQACLKLGAACTAAGLEYDSYALTKALTDHLDGFRRAGLLISYRSQTHVADLLYTKMCHYFGLDPAA